MHFADMHTGQVFTTAIRDNAHVHIRVVFDSFVEQIPYPVTGIDCDNGSEFINHALISWATTRNVSLCSSSSGEGHG